MILSRSPTNAFISVDLPTFGFPTIFTNPDLCIFLFIVISISLLSAQRSVFCQRSGLSSVSTTVCLLSAQRSLFCQPKAASITSPAALFRIVRLPSRQILSGSRQTQIGVLSPDSSPNHLTASAPSDTMSPTSCGRLYPLWSAH